MTTPTEASYSKQIKAQWKSKDKVIIIQFLPNALCPSCLQTTLASLNLLLDVPHTVPQALLAHISTLPSSGEEPPDSLISPSVQLAGLLNVANT